MVVSDPWSGGYRSHDCDHGGNDAPCKNDFGGVLNCMVLECPDDNEDEPGYSRGCTARMDSSNML